METSSQIGAVKEIVEVARVLGSNSIVCHTDCKSVVTFLLPTINLELEEETGEHYDYI